MLWSGLVRVQNLLLKEISHMKPVPRLVISKTVTYFSKLVHALTMQTLNYSLNLQLTALLLSYITKYADLSGLRFRDFLVQGDNELKQYI